LLREIARELGKAVSLILSILSLYALLGSAFFVPGSRCPDRLVGAFESLALATCMCFASGLLFRSTSRPEPPVTGTLPVRLFLWTLGGMVVMFLLSWYLETYYVPLLWKNQPH
jgi:hypothetical protein